MRVWVRLGIAALFITGAIVGVSLFGAQTILVENVRAVSHGGGLVGVTMDIRNTGGPDRLIDVDAPDAKMALVKSYVTAGAPIPAGSTVSLAMEGAHIMLGAVSGPMEDGRLIPLTLVFENAGPLSAKARFGAGEMDHGAMTMDGAGADYDVPEGEVPPTLSISAAARPDGGYDITIATTDFRFSREAADGPHEPGVGHGHLYAGGVKLGRVYDGTASIPPLPPGAHLIAVTLNTNDHRTYTVAGEPVTATAIVGD